MNFHNEIFKLNLRKKNRKLWPKSKVNQNLLKYIIFELEK